MQYSVQFSGPFNSMHIQFNASFNSMPHSSQCISNSMLHLIQWLTRSLCLEQIAENLGTSVSQKARKCSELSSNILRICSVKPSSKGPSRGWAQLIFFFGHQTELIFYSGVRSRLAWFLQCFHILSLTIKACQISLDYWLLAWMNLKRRSSTTTK